MSGHRIVDGEKAASRPPRAPKRGQPRPSGDDLGAAELARNVAFTIRERRKNRGMSLDDLAVASGVSRAALSQIETFKTNPTLGILWKIAVGLGVPFGDLIGTPRQSVGVLRRSDARSLRSADGKMESRALAPAGTAPWVELYELRLSARSTHESEAHPVGTHEVLVVLSGSARIRLGTETHELAAGDSIGFLADQAHVYENPGSSEARYVNVIIYQR
jgi:transcriptional regulator with XRE-family HTH domain